MKKLILLAIVAVNVFAFDERSYLFARKTYIKFREKIKIKK